MGAEIRSVLHAVDQVLGVLDPGPELKGLAFHGHADVVESADGVAGRVTEAEKHVARSRSRRPVRRPGRETRPSSIRSPVMRVEKRNTVPRSRRVLRRWRTTAGKRLLPMWGLASKRISRGAPWSTRTSSTSPTRGSLTRV